MEAVMAVKSKKFYWIKLYKDFMDGEIVDFLMTQKNGASYVLLYQKIIMLTINTDGELKTEIGETVIPFTANRIHRACKWFNLGTVKKAIVLFKQLGLLDEQSDGVLRVSNFERLVGSESYWAEKKRAERKEKDSLTAPDKKLDNVQQL